jgi:hypothetical protein
MAVDPSHLRRGRLVYGGGDSSTVYGGGDSFTEGYRFVYGRGDSSTERETRETRVQNISFDSGTNC